jgi:hypothetical protein
MEVFMNPSNYSTRVPLWIALLVVLSLGTTSTVSTAIAMPPPKDKKNHQDHDEVSVQVVFGERDRGIIHEYCAQPHSSLPPGLAKRNGKLPPGLEKQLRRNGQLPPGLQKKLQPFPVELERRLPPLPRNYARVFVEGRGLIVDAQFNIIDIIEVFR